MFFQLRTRAKARALAGALLSATGMASVLASAYLSAGSAHAEAVPSAQTPAFTQPTLGKIGDLRTLTAAVPNAPSVSASNSLAASQPAHDGRVDDPRELDCLSTAVYYEARGESSEGQAAVAQVILNRATHGAFPKTVCGVVYQGAPIRSCQFSFVCNGAMHHRREPGAWARARGIAARALGGYVMAEIGGATCFHAARIGPGRGPRVGRVIRIGGHVFYGEGRAGSASMLRGREYADNEGHAAAARAIVHADRPLVAMGPTPVAADLRGVDASFKGPINAFFGS